MYQNRKGENLSMKIADPSPQQICTISVYMCLPCQMKCNCSKMCGLFILQNIAMESEHIQNHFIKAYDEHVQTFAILIYAS